MTYVPTAELLTDIHELATIRHDAVEGETAATREYNHWLALYQRADRDMDLLLAKVAARLAVEDAITANINDIEERGKVLVDGRWVDDPDDDGTLMGGLPWAERAIA